MGVDFSSKATKVSSILVRFENTSPIIGEIGRVYCLHDIISNIHEVFEKNVL